MIHLYSNLPIEQYLLSHFALVFRLLTMWRSLRILLIVGERLHNYVRCLLRTLTPTLWLRLICPASRGSRGDFARPRQWILSMHFINHAIIRRLVHRPIRLRVGS